MSSTYTTRNRLEKQGTGENSNSWGLRLNAYTFDLMDASLDGIVAFTLSGNKTLTSANGADDESRRRFLRVTGGTGGTITIPSVEKWYIVRNGASGNVTLTTGAGTAAVVAPTITTFIACDGTNVYTADFSAYVAAAEQAKVDAEDARDAALLAQSGAETAETNAETAEINAEAAQLAAENARDAAQGYRDQAEAASEIPNQAGHAGKVLTTNGANTSWGDVSTVWKQIGQVTVSTATAQITFSSIPQTYTELMVKAVGLTDSGVSGSTSLILGISAGTSSSATLGSHTSASLHGAIVIGNYTDVTGPIGGSFRDGVEGVGVPGTGAPTSWARPEGISFIRLSRGAGDYTAGTVTLYAR